MICMRTGLPVGMTSMMALPSGSVLTSRLPSSLPSWMGLKTTAAFTIGLPLKPLDDGDIDVRGVRRRLVLATMS